MSDIKTVFIDNGSDEALLKSMAEEDSGKIDQEELEKAMDRSGLVQREVTVHGKHGTHTRKQWVRASEDQKSDRRPRAKEDSKGDRKISSTTAQYLKSISSAFKKGTVVDVRTGEGEFRGEVLSISVGSKGSMVGRIKDADGRVHKVSRGLDGSFEPCSKEEAEEFLGRQLFPVRYFPVGSNSSKGYSEDTVKGHYMKHSEPGVTFDEYVRENYFISDGYTKTDKFYKDGDSYKPYRQELHDKIVKGIVDSCDKPPAGSKPVCFLYGGGSASGKSSTADKMRQAFVESNGVEIGTVDSDEIKKSIPEFAPFKDQYVKSAALRVHDESSDIANEAIDACIAEGRCFAFDGTMKNLEKYTGIVEKLHEAGYHVVAVGTDIPTEEAIKRSDARAKKSGRDVPHSIIKGSHGGFAATFPKMMEQVDEYYLYDNSQPFGEPPTLICSTGETQNQKRWDEFVKKGNDHLEAKKAKEGK